MTCYEMGSIQSYIDGELSREERKQFIKHLDKCMECQNLLIELTELNQWEHSTLAEEKLHETLEINIDVEKHGKHLMVITRLIMYLVQIKR